MPDRLILGLGNPGPKYRETRHNCGFRVVEELARRRKLSLGRLECKSLLAEGRDVVLAAPQTYMNRSGYAARCLSERREIEPADILIVYDDVAETIDEFGQLDCLVCNAGGTGVEWLPNTWQKASSSSMTIPRIVAWRASSCLAASPKPRFRRSTVLRLSPGSCAGLSTWGAFPTSSGMKNWSTPIRVCVRFKKRMQMISSGAKR